MKNIKLYAVLGLCFGMLFLTACGGEKKDTPVLTCSQEEETSGLKLKLKLSYDKDEKEPQSAEMTLSLDIPEGTDDEAIESVKEQLEMAYCVNNELKCNVKKSGDTLVVNISGKFQTIVKSGILDMSGDSDLTLEGLKKSTEADGATCKKSYE